MAYAKTSRYQLPVWIANEPSSGFQEQRAGDIIDSQLEVVDALVGYNSSYPGVVISEGIFSATFSSGNSSLTIPSLKGIVNGVFVESVNSKSVSSMVNNQTYYVYAGLTSETDPATTSSLSKRSWNLSVGTNGLTPVNNLLIGKVITTSTTATVWYGENQLPSINVGNDTNKAYYKSIVEHRSQPTMDHPSQSISYWHLSNTASLMPTQIRPLGPSLSDLQATQQIFLGAGSVYLPSILNNEIQGLRYMIGKLSGQATWYAPVNVPTFITSTGVLTFDVGLARVYTSGGVVSVGLPTAALSPGKKFDIAKGDNSSNIVAVYPLVGTINGTALVSMNTQYAMWNFISDGSNYVGKL